MTRRRLLPLALRAPISQLSRPMESTVVPAKQHVARESGKLENSDITMSTPHSSDAAYQTNEQQSVPMDSCVQESNKFGAESDNNATTPSGVDMHAQSVTSPETAVEPSMDAYVGTDARDGRAEPPMSKSPSKFSIREAPKKLWGKLNAPRGIKPFGHAERKRRGSRGSKTKVQITIPSQKQPDVACESLAGEPTRSGDTRPEGKEASYVEDNQQTSTDTKDTEPTVTEPEEVEKLRRDLLKSQSQIAELQKRCEAQSRDLENSNNFLNTADKSSDLDIILALQRLNAEVQQNTTYMADCMVEDFEFENMTANPTKDQTSATVQGVSAYIGQVLAKSLETKATEDISMLLQIAFQAYLASALSQTASSWSFEPAHNTFIDDIYQRLRRGEAQAISGRWRSLARFHNVHTWVAHPESLVKGIIADIANIMLAAGCAADQSDIISKVTSKFGDKIFLLVGLAGRLNKMFDEVISSDFEVFAVRPGEKFDAKMMEDADADQARIETGPVLCTTHLGLIKQIPVGTLWDRGKKQKVVILKAKVLPESFLTAGDQ